MRRMVVKGVVLVVLLLSLADVALAHSTKGRKKVDLDVDQPTVDDFAFFMEGYVLQELYRNREPKWENRYYVKEFKGVELLGNRAEVSFIALDVKTNDDFADIMRFERGNDGIWFFTAADGHTIKVHTYVTTSAYFAKKYGKTLPLIGLAGAIAGLMLLMALLRRRLAQSADGDQGPAWQAAIIDNQADDQPENPDRHQANG
ncbi:hypothetical protein [Desulfobulbus propionicus]